MTLPLKDFAYETLKSPFSTHLTTDHFFISKHSA